MKSTRFISFGLAQKSKLLTALLLLIPALIGCESTDGGGTHVSGGVYYGVGLYDPWYYGPGYYPPDVIVTPPPSGGTTPSPPRPTHPIAMPPASSMPRPTPMPSIPSAPRPAMRAR